jgi:hypothetical protein
MKCCKDNQQKLDRIAEKVILLHGIVNRGRCVLCQSEADESFIEFD